MFLIKMFLIKKRVYVHVT